MAQEAVGSNPIIRPNKYLVKRHPRGVFFCAPGAVQKMASLHLNYWLYKNICATLHPLIMDKSNANHIKAVVFDFDDTLIGTHVAIWDLHRHIARSHYNIELDDASIKTHWGRPLPELAKHYYQTDAVEEAITRMMQYQPDFPKTKFEHAEPLIRNLKLSGKIIGIVSATTRPILDKDVELVGLPLDEFDYIQTAEDTEYHKPDPRVFDPLLASVAHIAVYPQNVLYVGDGIQDMYAANAAGLKFMGVTTGIVTADEFAEHGAQSIDDLSQLQRIIS